MFNKWPVISLFLLLGSASGAGYCATGSAVSNIFTLNTRGDTPTGIEEIARESLVPRAFRVSANYPNPFNPGTTIRIALPRAGAVLIRIHDVQGRLVRTLVREQLSPGVHDVRWDGTDRTGRAVSSGTYFCEVRFAGAAQVRPMQLVR